MVTKEDRDIVIVFGAVLAYLILAYFMGWWERVMWILEMPGF